LVDEVVGLYEFKADGYGLPGCDGISIPSGSFLLDSNHEQDEGRFCAWLETKRFKKWFVIKVWVR